MTQLRHLWGLPPEKLRPRMDEVSAVVSVGIKDRQNGAPIDKDCYTVLEGKPILSKGTKRRFEYRRRDRRFAEFNNLPKGERRFFYGHLVHHDLREAWHPGYYAYRLPAPFPNPRTNAAACHGNGDRADRWDPNLPNDRGGMGAHRDMECPGEGCPYRMGEKPACKAGMRLWFRPVWKTVQGKMIARWTADQKVVQLLERPEMRFSSPQGEKARETFQGMIRRVEEDAARFKITINSWFGLPFQMAWSEGTNPEKRTRWPETSFSLDGEWMDWLRWQASEFQSLLDAAPTVLMLGSASPEELDAENRGSDYAAIMPVTTSKPAPVEPMDVEIVDELPEAASASPPAPPPSDTAAGSFSNDNVSNAGAGGSSDSGGSRFDGQPLRTGPVSLDSSERTPPAGTQRRETCESADGEEPGTGASPEPGGSVEPPGASPTYYRTPQDCDHPLAMIESRGEVRTCTACGEVVGGGKTPADYSSPDAPEEEKFDPYEYLKIWMQRKGFWDRKMEAIIPLRRAGILPVDANWSDVPPATTREELDAVLDELEKP